ARSSGWRYATRCGGRRAMRGQCPVGLERVSLAGKVALITGASRGVGAAAARSFPAAGADVGRLSPSGPDLDRPAQGTRGHGRRAVALACDVTDADQVAAAVASTIKQLGRIDVLVNNAGGPVFNAPFLDIREAGWHKVLDLNLTSVMRLCQQVGRHMTARG